MTTYYIANDAIEGKQIYCYARKYDISDKKVRCKSKHHCYLIKLRKYAKCIIVKPAVEWIED